MHYDTLSSIHFLIDRDKLDLALDKVNELLSQYPDSDELHALEAEIFLRKEDYTKAKRAVETAIGLNPENDSLYYTSARIALGREDTRTALNQIDEAISLNPYQAAYYGLKAAVLIDQSKYQEAVFYAEKGLEIDPDDVMSNNMLSLAHNRMGKFDEAYNRLEGLLANDPENTLTQANTGYYYLHKGDVKKAKEHFAAALNSDPTSEFARAGMIQAIKSTNFFYAKLLQFSYWIERTAGRNRWAFYIGIILIVKIIPILAPFYLMLLLWAWFTGPLSDVVLYFDKYGRYLMTKLSLQLTRINIGILALTLVSVALAIALDKSFAVLAFGLFLTIIPVYMLDVSTKPSKRLAMVAFGAVFTGVGVYGMVNGFVLGESVAIAAGILAFSAIAFSWIVALWD